MLSRHSLLTTRLTPALNFLKVENAAHIHVGCNHSLRLTLSACKFSKNYRINVFNTGLQARLQSSSSSTTYLPSNESASGLDPIPEPPQPLSELTQSAVEGFAGEPSFSSLGLGGWTPVGWVQNALEFLHVDCGLPWWGAVVFGTVVVRILMFPLVIIAQRNSSKLNNNLPEMQHLQMKITEARQRGDKLDAARYTAEMMKFMQEKEINPLKNMITPLCQAPVFVSVFMGLRGMSALPVESLKTGGMWWFVDLTVPDQFYILPVITSATLYLTIKFGADGTQSNQNMLLMKYLLRALPVILIPFTINFPGLMLVYWTSSNFISLAQVGFLQIPKVRKYFRIEKKKKHQDSNLELKDKGFVGNMKDAWTNLKITSELDQRERVDRMAFMKAGRDPVKKTYKYYPSNAIQAKKKT